MIVCPKNGCRACGKCCGKDPCKASHAASDPSNKRVIRAVLVGNPNCGKTTLFNALTGMRRRTANYPGVTVDSHSAKIEHDGRTVLITDLPGAYSIENCTAEEKITRNGIINDDPNLRPNAIISILDATALPRGLALARELQTSKIPTVTAVSMVDVLEQKGKRLRFDSLSRYLHSPVVPVLARSGEGLTLLLDELIRTADKQDKPIRISANRLTNYEKEPPMSRFITGMDSTSEKNMTDIADRIITGCGAPFLFAALMLICGFAVFSLGGKAAELLGTVIGSFSSVLCVQLSSLGLHPHLLSLISDGIVPGITGVLSFLPQIGLLFLALGFFEDCGYMARIAFITDGFFSRIGLSGRASVPMLLGFGCTVPAVLSTRTIKSRSEQLRVIAAVPFISCGARLPVYILICTVFFPDIIPAVILLLYSVGICVAAIVSGIGAKKKNENSSLFIELPDYRTPHLKSVYLYAADKMREFLTRASTVILLSSVIMWFIANIGPDGYCTTMSENSYAFIIGKLISPLLSPIGLSVPAVALALICGLVSKESIVSSLYVLYGVSTPSALGTALTENGITVQAGAAFLTFVLLYTPCAAAFAAVCRETSPSFAIKTGLFQLLIAFGTAAAVYTTFPLIHYGIDLLLTLM